MRFWIRVAASVDTVDAVQLIHWRGGCHLEEESRGAQGGLVQDPRNIIDAVKPVIFCVGDVKVLSA